MILLLTELQIFAYLSAAKSTWTSEYNYFLQREYNYSLQREYKWIQLLLTARIQVNTTTPYSGNTNEYNYSLQREYKWIQLLITVGIQVNTTTP